jgi:hypothetical protein
MVVKMDLIKTIADGEEVPNYSESSDEEEEVSHICFPPGYYLLSFLQSLFSFNTLYEI